jgi:PAS domain S-box-containing protein
MARAFSHTDSSSQAEVASNAALNAAVSPGAILTQPTDARAASTPLANYFDNEDLEFNRVVMIARTGALLVVACQFLYLGWDVSVCGLHSVRLMLCHGCNILVGCVALALTLSNRPWLAIHWRTLVFLICTVEIAGMARISIITGESESVFVAGMLFIVASGSTLPWEPKWQAAFSLASLAAIALSLPYTRDGVGGFQWVEVFCAIVFAQVTNLTLAGYREASLGRLLGLRATEERLRAEIIHRQYTADMLAESEAMLRTIFDATVDLITIVRFSDAELIDVNAAIEHYGFTRAMVLGTTTFGLDLLPDPERRAEFLVQLNRDGIVRNLQFDLAHPHNGTLVSILMSSAIAQINGEKCVVSIVRDISQLKAYERELIAAREAALAASQAKSEFLSDMSHEIRTPMNAILGMAELLSETPLDDQQRNYLAVMQANGDSLIALINDILDLSKVESGRLNLEQASFNLETVADAIGATLGVSAHAKGLELVVRLESKVPRHLVGDPLRLKQVLINLVGNAIKFTEHGEVVVRIDREPGADEPGRLRFAVADTGIGIAPDKIANLFSSFTQVDSSIARRFGGSGLGLSIVRRLVELMDGRTWIESRLGAGSTFFFTANFGVDAVAALALEISGPTSVATLAQLAGLRALVVDDNRVNRMVVREIIAAKGIDVAEADSGVQALGELESARRAGLPFDLMILDCRMPVMDGFEVIQHVRQGADHDDTVVLMLTSDDLKIQIPRVRELGLDAYIVKPVRRVELLTAITSALAARNRPTPSPEANHKTAPPEPGRRTALVEPDRVNSADSAANARDRPSLSIIANPSGSAPGTVTPVGGSRRLLLVDDSADNRLLIRSYLRRASYLIDEATDGDAAFQKATGDHYDLILMDLQMPLVDGLQATRMIREWELANDVPRTPIIVLTASALEEDVMRALAAGADAHVSKPITRAMLMEATRRFMPAPEQSAPLCCEPTTATD